jgi:hypothetical protein
VFDPVWYCESYPDVRLSGIPPLDHFLNVGLWTERNPEPGFDSWKYRKEHGLEDESVVPLLHFLRVSTSASCESTHSLNCAKVNAPWKDAKSKGASTEAQNHLAHFLAVGKNEKGCPNQEQNWSKTAREQLDCDWYLKRNLDVIDSKMDPLDHYLSIGIHQRRKPNRDFYLEYRPVLSAEIKCLKDQKSGSRVALFVTHTSDGIIKPHVEIYLTSLRTLGIDIILLIATDKEEFHLPDNLWSLANLIYLRKNEGYDFAAWSHLLQIRPSLYESEILFFLNDSVLGPFNIGLFKSIHEKILNSKADFLGLTENWERGWHIQSYFLTFKKQVLRSSVFEKYMAEIVSYSNKEYVINEYEATLTKYLIANGFECEVLFPSFNRREPAITFQWKNLIDRGFPFLKIGLLRGKNPNVNMIGWRETLSSRGYNLEIADGTLCRLNADSNSM